MIELEFLTSLSPVRSCDDVLVLAPRRAFEDGLAERLVPGAWSKALPRMLAGASAGGLGTALTTWTGAERPAKVTLGLLPEEVSRHCAPARSLPVASLAAKAGLTAPGDHAVVAVLDDPAHYLPVANAVARALPLYSRQAPPKAGRRPTRVRFLALDRDGRAIRPDKVVTTTVPAARWAASLVDRPTAELDAAVFAAEARKAFRGAPDVTVEEIVGDELLARGLGGIHAVGRAAAVAPRLLVIDYRPRGARRTVALVGKGIVYDTGGLNLKPREGMGGMKGDMGGGAAVVAAAMALVAQRVRTRLVTLVPLAENAIGPDAYRQDDILTLHSGKTVEINNTDAEGRLLLADATSYAARVYQADLVVDAATLTGAQLIATGKNHAAVVSNRAGLEALAVAAGRTSGDLTHPLPFAPELYQAEFKSEVADMVNSVADRANAQASCAAQFVWSHLEDTGVPWLHVDLAGPAMPGKRGTGYGVALLGEVVRGLEAEHLRA